MLMIISPAKTLDYESPLKTESFTIPDYLENSAELIEIMSKKSLRDLVKMMQVSQKIAELNVDRFKSWELPFSPVNARQALLAFKGDVYNGINTSTLSEDDFSYAQRHLRILSGLYGLLRPLDLIQPYRLEMGLKLNSKKVNTLYQFWGDKITDELTLLLEEQETPVLVNLASNEYFKSVKTKNLECRLITPEFRDLKNGEYKIVQFFAKKARGLMVRYAIDNSIIKSEDLKNFDYDGYTFNSKLSLTDKWVFSRN
ncbi:MAG: hypothetical protein CL935_04490 [Deltaproteobacteria bacterium]|nr:hypothetical protein [Deltaproteobacteria bacterium]|tara:strand:- start:4334 stop:5101 length:768 start_codon:yes stop_codon:yes gene_type:complete